MTTSPEREAVVAERKLWSPGPLILSMGIIVTLNCVEFAFGRWAAQMLGFSLMGYVVGWVACDLRRYFERGDHLKDRPE